MADGDLLIPSGFPGSSGSVVYKLLDAASAAGADNGVWVSTAEYASGLVVITGVATLAIVEVDGKNDLTQPAPSDQGVPLGATSAGANGSVQVLVLPRWIKARIQTVGTGTVNAFAIFRAQLSS